MDNATQNALPGYASLDEVMNNSIGSLHFRFLCRDALAEQALLDSLSRTWNELLAFFSDCPLLLDLSNVYNMGTYPLSNREDTSITHWDVWEPDVYSDDRIICGAPFSDRNMRKVDGLLSRLYAEQFVCRMSFFATVPLQDHAESILSILKNMLQNADVPGVGLLSMEDISPLDFFPVDFAKILPELGESLSYQPTRGLKRRASLYLDPASMGWLNSEEGRTMQDRWLGDVVACPTQFIVQNQAHAFSQDDSLALDKGGLYSRLILSTMYGRADGKYGDVPALIARSHKGHHWPVWYMGTDEDALCLYRMVQIPVLDDVHDVFFASRAFPVCSKFGEREGVEYLNLLAESNVTPLVSLIESGLQLERLVSEDGDVFFDVFLPLNDEKMAHVFTGKEGQVEDYLCQLRDFMQDGGDLDPEDAATLSVGMDCFPSNDVKITTKTIHS